MTFTLTMSKYFFQKDEMEPYKRLGFTFKNNTSPASGLGEYCLDDDTTINIDTIEEILKLSEEFGELIIDGRQIEIYNSYRE